MTRLTQVGHRCLDRHTSLPAVNSARNHGGAGDIMAEARVERRLAAILAADVAGYSRLMGVDEEGTLAALKAYRSELIDPKRSTFNFDHGDTLVGWTAGAGAEYALSPSWSVKAEYQHFDFGKISYWYSGCHAIPGNYAWANDKSYGTCPAANSQYSNHYTSTVDGKTDVSITADAVKIGINYHLNNEAELK